MRKRYRKVEIKLEDIFNSSKSYMGKVLEHATEDDIEDALEPILEEFINMYETDKDVPSLILQYELTGIITMGKFKITVVKY